MSLTRRMEYLKKKELRMEIRKEDKYIMRMIYSLWNSKID